jgi:cell wall-associated NlpC family hydrolase
MKKYISILLALTMLLCLSVAAPVSASAKDKKDETVTGSEIVEYAEQYLGKPYRYAAKGPYAFDCSGFVYYVFGHFGYSMPCSSAAYWNAPSSVGRVVGYSNLKNAKKGDIISWRGHVAIYIGNGRCIEALNYGYGVTERLGVYAHAAGNGSSFRVIRMKNVVSKKTYSKRVMRKARVNAIIDSNEATGEAEPSVVTATVNSSAMCATDTPVTL